MICIECLGFRSSHGGYDFGALDGATEDTRPDHPTSEKPPSYRQRKAAEEKERVSSTFFSFSQILNLFENVTVDLTLKRARYPFTAG